jgi:type IX secretion system PorP/SprF family membrane protein
MKNILIKLSLSLSLLVSMVHRSMAQTDPHFTQNYTYPMYINPAMTGSSDGDYRVSAIYRSQWGSVGNAYRTGGLSFDTRTNNNLALGINLMNQSAGNAGFNYFNTYASIAYTGVKFGKTDNHRIVIAMQAGLISRSVNASKFKWGEQWNPITGYNSSNMTTETFAATSSTTLDMGAGAMYYDASPNKRFNIFGGFSLFHINKPADPIISSHSVELNTIPARYTVHGGLSVNLSGGASIVPHFLYNQQGNARETMLGVYGKKNVNEETDVMLGIYYRYKDAIAPYMGVDYKNFLVGLSYDLNTSTLGTGIRNVNSFELSFSYIMRKAVKTNFEFNPCPRL